MMKNPPHPGEILREDILAEIAMPVAEAARRLGVSRVALSRVVNAKAPINADLALRLELAGLSQAKFWLDMQSHYDLAQVRQRSVPHIEPIRESAA